MEALDEIFQYLDGATRYERYIACRCPFHSDSRPSFFVYADSYYCSACGVKGKTETLLETLRRRQGTYIPIRETVDFRSPWSRWMRVYGELDVICIKAHKNLLQHNKTSYLKKRGVDIETIRELKIGWLDDWITFPIRDEYGNIIGATARAGETNNSLAKYCNFPKQDPNLLYVPDWKRVKESTKFFVVFGIIDIISIHQLGYAGASTTTGKRIDPTAFDCIRKPIYIVPDKGEEVAAALLSARLGWRGKAVKINWPSDTKDCNDLFLKNRELLVSILRG